MNESGDADRPTRRRRDASATRAALLNAAAELFAERGFDQTTVRQVAERAGVNQALLFRYFGSKQELFAKLLTESNQPLLDARTAEDMVRQAIEGVLGKEGTDGRMLLVMLRSLGDAQAADVLREQVGSRYVAGLAELTTAEDAELRAELVLAWLFGLAMMRSVIPRPSLVNADPDVSAAHLCRAIGTLLEQFPASSE